MTFAQPNKEDIIKSILENFPESFLAKPIWVAYYYKKQKNGKYTKPPVDGKAIAKGAKGKPFNEVIKLGFPGILMNDQHDLIAFDIDDNEAKLGRRRFGVHLFSDEFSQFVMSSNSYMEYSPSKCGARILMRCPDKHLIHGRPALNEDCIGGELFANSGYVTITGDFIAGEDFSTVSAEQALQWASKTEEVAEVVEFPKSHIKMPSIKDVAAALNVCKLTQSTQVKNAYQEVTGQSYNHYDYWLKILAACHHYAKETDQLMDVAQLIVEWSQTDDVAYESEEDVLSTFGSFGNKTDNKITYSTLFKFAKLLRFDWPRPAYDSKGNLTGGPELNSVKNYEYLMSYYEIELIQEVMTGKIFVKGDKDILHKYFKRGSFFGMVGPFTQDALVHAAWTMAQEEGYGSVPQSTIRTQILGYFNTYCKQESLLKLWLETPRNQLPDDLLEEGTDPALSNLEYLLSCFTFSPNQNIELIRNYFKVFFYELTMPIYNPTRIFSMRSFMLVLAGREHTYKSTFFEELFPHSFSRDFVTSSKETLKDGKSQRDLQRSLTTSAIVVIDEFEIFYNKANDSLFKTIVTSDRMDFTDIYKTTTDKSNRMAVLAGTTNKTHFPFERDSNRRFALVHVDAIDTDAMRKINWHTFYRWFVKTGKEALARGKYLWKAGQSMTDLQYLENEKYRAQSNLEVVFHEIFDMYAEPGDIGKITSVQTSEYLMSMAQIKHAIKMHDPDIRIKPAELKHLASQVSARYSKTTNKYEELPCCKGTVSNGIFKQGQWTKYMMPPLKSNTIPGFTCKDFK